MSTSAAYVRFPDGTIRASVYDGTVDLVVPQLHDTAHEAFTHWHSTLVRFRNRFNHLVRHRGPQSGPVQAVEIYAAYGRSWREGDRGENLCVEGFWWEGEAWNSLLCHDSCQPHQPGREVHNGRPWWVRVPPAPAPDGETE
jgi:hypothetical protein